jgi:predicted NBD/HSP70 family sugar kinase
VVRVTYGPSLLRTPGGAAPTGTTTLRRANLSLVLRELRDHISLSRAEIAQATGLHRATVSNLMAELLERQLVREVGVEHVGAIGRPRRAVALHGAHVGALGMEINVDYIAVHGTDLSGRSLVERRVVHDAMGSGPDSAVRRLGLVAKEAVEAMRRAGAVPAGVAVAVPGLVDVARGVVTLAPNLHWRDLPLAEQLSAILGRPRVPVRVDNDANLAALAEYTSGVAAGTPHLVYLTGEVGVGGGIISGGDLLRGADGFSGEVGHLRVDPNGEECGCGRIGCWETMVGLRALLDAAADPDDPVRHPGLALDDRLHELNRRAGLGDTRTLAALEQIGHWVGVGAGAMANALNPGAVVLSGYFAEVGRWMIPAVVAALQEAVLAPDAGGTRVELSTLGFTAAVRGAATASLDIVFHDPTSVDRRVAPPIGGNR